MRALVVAVLIAASSAYAAPLGPSNPPPGAISKYWAQTTARAAWVRKAVEALAPNTKGACIEAVALDILGNMDADWSVDAKGRGPGTRRYVEKGKEEDFRKALKRNADDRCKDDDGPGGDGKALQATVRGLLQFAEDVDNWTTSGHGDLKERVRGAAEAMAGMGLFAGSAAKQGATAPVGVFLPILPPSLFMTETPDTL